MSWEVIDGLLCELGESPVWFDDRLLLIDIPSQRLHIVSDGSVNSVALARRVTAVVPATNGWVGVSGRTIGRIEIETGEFAPLVTIPGPDDMLLNDAVAGPDGTLYTGSVDRTGSARGELYGVDAAGTVTTLAVGLRAANGMDVAADGSLVYADTLADTVTLGVGGPGLAVEHPDGLTIDDDGGIWVALWGHGKVVRYFDGEIERILEVPAVNVSSVAFGGADLDVLYVTTATSERDGGPVFYCRPGVLGRPPASYLLA